VHFQTLMHAFEVAEINRVLLLKFTLLLIYKFECFYICLFVTDKLGSLTVCPHMWYIFLSEWSRECFGN